MSETSTETPAADGEGERIHSLEDMSAKIDQLMEWAKGGGKKAEPDAEEPLDVKAEMRKQLQELQAEEKRKAAREKEKADGEARLAAIEDKVKEKPPREYRKVENWHRWRLPEEK